MATETVEARLYDLEQRLRRVETKVGDSDGEDLPWWRKIAGRFKDNPEFDEAMRLGREYRKSLTPDDAD